MSIIATADSFEASRFMPVFIHSGHHPIATTIMVWQSGILQASVEAGAPCFLPTSVTQPKTSVKARIPGHIETGGSRYLRRVHSAVPYFFSRKASAV